MAPISEVLKDQRIFSVDADQTVMEAVRLMTEFNIGAVPVMRGGELAGIFSERDLMRRVVAAGRSPGLTPVGEVMTPKPRTVNASDSIEDCLFLMRESGFRHLPVFDGKVLKGVVSLRDIMLREARHSTGGA